ncbi:MAG: D-hexose-6-phosphate mutarotase, partial [Aeromonas sobria]
MHTIRPLTANCQLANNAAGLPVLTINNDYGKAEISLFGAHVLSYQRHGEPASIWLSDKAVLDGSKPIRGGIPLCWPWFGPAPARVGSGKPSHGFARTTLWELDGVSDHADGTLVHLSLRD